MSSDVEVSMHTKYLRDQDIMIVDDLVSREELAKLRGFLSDRTEWQPAEVYRGTEKLVSDVRSCENIYISREAHVNRNQDYEWLDSALKDMFFGVLTEYLKSHPQLIIEQDEGYEVIRYGKGQEFKPHVDFNRHMPHPRQVSVCFYLNDDYEGGELNFPSLNIKIKPKAGTIVVFPSNYVYLHQSMPVLEGVKFSIVTWFN